MRQNRIFVSYSLQFEDKVAHFREKLACYLDAPCVVNTHDVRTSFRRLEACYSVIPSVVKTHHSDKFVEAGRQLFRRNSIVRDSDIILEKLRSRDDLDTGQLLDNLHQLRAENLTKAMKQAAELSLFPDPHLHNKKISFRRHLQQKVNHRIQKIQHYIPLIRDDEFDIDELHSMRKQVKKLLYLLELRITIAGSPEMKILKKMQTLAGNIHDCDVTIDFLNKNSELTNDLDSLIHLEQFERHAFYTEMLPVLSRNIWPSLKCLA